MLADTLLGMALKEALKKSSELFKNSISYQIELEKKIISIIEEYKKSYKYSPGFTTAFFEVELTTDCLSKYIYFHDSESALLNLDYSSYPNIAPPTIEELQSFRDFVLMKLQGDEQLRKLFCLEQFPEAILKTQKATEEIQNQLQVVTSRILKDEENAIPQIILPEKKIYTLDFIPIERTYWNFEEGSKRKFFEPIKNYTIVELAEENSAKKIKLVSEGGNGKSSQLDILANHLSMHSVYYPVKISLKDYRGSISRLLDAEFSQWKKIPEQQLFLILDAFDEILSDQVAAAIADINLISKTYKEAKIFVSSRNYATTVNNEFREGDLTDFAVYSLQPINRNQRESFLGRVLGSNKLKFEHQLEKQRLHELTENAFFLTSLVKMFNSSGEKRLPETRKEVMEFLLSSSLGSDAEKDEQTAGQWREKKHIVIEVLSIIATSMIMLDKEELFYDETIRITKDSEIVSLILKSSLINQPNGRAKNIRFIHNNIKEYLAARKLASLPLEVVKQYLFFPPDNSCFKIKWTNVCVFLFDILEGNSILYSQLLDHFINNAPNAIVRFEKSKIALDLREKIFINITTHYWKRGISFFISQLHDESLIEFSGGSNNIVDYLFSSLNNAKTEDVKRDALILLGLSEYVGPLSSEIASAAVELVTDKDNNLTTRYQALNVLAKLRLANDNITKSLIENCDYKQDEDRIREGLCNYIYENGLSDQHTDFVLELLSITFNRREKLSTIRNLNDSYYIKSFIESISSSESIKKVVLFLTKDIKYGYYEDSSVLDKAVEKAVTLFYKDSTVFDTMLQCAAKVCATPAWRPNQRKVINFFEETNTAEAAFNYFFENRTIHNDFDWIYPNVATKNNVDHFINELKKEAITENEVWRFLYISAVGNPVIRNYLYEQLDVEVPGKFRYSTGPTPDELDQQRIKRDVELLENKSEFIKLIEDFFQRSNQVSFTDDELWDPESEVQSDYEVNNNLVLDTLRRFFGRRGVTLEKVVEYFSNQEKWERFRIFRYYTMIEKNRNLLSETIIQFIQGWCDKTISKINFTTIYFIKNDLLHWFTDPLKLAGYCIKFYTDLKINIAGEKVIEMLHIAEASHNKEKKSLHEVILSNIDVDKVKKAVLANLKSKSVVFESALHIHIKLCGELMIKESSELLYDILFDSKAKGYLRNEAFASLKNINDDVKRLDNLVPKFTLTQDDNYWQTDIINYMISRNSQPLLNHFKSLLEGDFDDNIKIQAAQYLVNLSDISGIQYLANEYKNVSFSLNGYRSINTDFAKLNLDDALPQFMDILLTYYKIHYGETFFHDLKDSIVNTLYELAGLSVENYVSIRGALIQLRDSNSTVNQIHQVNYTLERLSEAYYKSVSAKMTIEEVCRFNDELMIA